MRFRFTLFLLVANLAVFGLIWNDARRRNIEPPREELVFPSEPETLTLATGADATSYTLRRTVNRWSLEKPFRWPANEWAVHQLLDQLRIVSRAGHFSLAEARRQGGATDRDYGLDKPLCSLTVAAGTRSVTVKIGELTPDGNSRYMLADDGDAILPVSNKLLAALVRTPEQMRREEVFAIDSYEVRAVDVMTADKSAAEPRVRLVLDRRELPGGEFKPVWNFEIPVTSDADTPVVKNALSELGALKYLRFLESTPERLALAGLEDPEFSLTIDGNNRSQTLLVGKPDPDSKTPYRFAKLKDNPAIFTLPSAALDIWRALPVSMREPHFLRMDDATLTGITLHIDGLALTLHSIDTQTGDAKPATASGKTDVREWQMPVIPGGKVTAVTPVDPDVLETLRNSLANLSAGGLQPPSDATTEIRDLCRAFVTDKPTPEQLRDWGLANPKWRVELAFTRDGKNFTRVLRIAPPVAPRTPYHAKLDDAPTVYSIRPGIVSPDILSVKPETYRRRLIFAMRDGDTLTAIRIRDLATGKTLREVAKPDDVATWDKWTETMPEKDRGALLTLVKTMRRLHARSYLDKPFAEDFKYDAGDGTPPEGWRYAIEWDVRPAGGDASRSDKHTLMTTRRFGGSTQLGGIRNAGLVFELPQDWVDALFPLTFGKDTSVDLPAIPAPAKPGPAPKPAGEATPAEAAK